MDPQKRVSCSPSTWSQAPSSKSPNTGTQSPTTCPRSTSSRLQRHDSYCIHRHYVELQVDSPSRKSTRNRFLDRFRLVKSKIVTERTHQQSETSNNEILGSKANCLAFDSQSQCAARSQSLRSRSSPLFTAHRRGLSSLSRQFSRHTAQGIRREESATEYRDKKPRTRLKMESGMYASSADTLIGSTHQESRKPDTDSINDSIPPPIPAKSPRRMYSDAPTRPDNVPPTAESSGEASNTVKEQLDENDNLKPIGRWRCCKCGGDQELFEYTHSQHPVSIVSCACSHRSCDDCVLTGNIKPYKPVREPFVIPESKDHKEIRFGVFCGNCGLSWRAQVVKQSVMQKLSTVPKHLAKHSSTVEKIRRSKSMADFFGEPKPLQHTNSITSVRQLSNEMTKTHGEQAPTVLVAISGINCTCGHVLTSSELCFRLTDSAPAPPPKRVAFASAVRDNQPSFTATPEDRIRGIGTPTLTLQNRGRMIRHANPLASNPVTNEELERLGLRSPAGASRNPGA